jgi:hypothetical protein
LIRGTFLLLLLRKMNDLLFLSSSNTLATLFILIIFRPFIRIILFVVYCCVF